MPVVLYVDRNGFFWIESSARCAEVTLNFKRCGQQLELISQTGNPVNIDIARAKAFVMKKAA